MKKIFIALAIITMGTSAISFAQSTTPEQRQQRRQQRQEESIGLLKEALAEQTFVFYPQSYTLPYQNPVQIYSSGSYYIDFYPESFDMNVPFEINGGQPFTFNTSLSNYSNYTVTNTGDGVNFIITAQLDNISNSNMGAGFDAQNINLQFHMSVNLLSANAIISIYPNFSAPISYQGTVYSNQ